MKTKAAQFPLGLDHTPSSELSDFLVSETNSQALTHVRSWPNWVSHGACIYGPEGCGKTHLMSALSRNTSIKLVKATDSLEKLESFRHFIIEDVDSLDYPDDLLFHLYNWSKEQGGTVIFTARKAPSQWAITLPDLKSRLGLLQVFEIEEPDDHLLEMIYYKLFSDRQIQVDGSLVKYLLVHGERSFAAALLNVTKLDREALARKSKISRKLAAEIL